MDPWKIATAALGTLSAVLFTALVVVWTSASTTPEPLPPLPDSVAAADAQAPSQPARAVEPAPAPIERPLIQDTPTRATTESAGASAPSWVHDPSQPLPQDVLDRAREQMMEGRQARRDEMRDVIRDDIDAFLDDEGVDAATADRVHDLLDQYGEKMNALREQMRSGEVDRMEARQSFREQRQALSAALDETLGTDTAGRLRETLPGRRPRGEGPMRPGGRVRGGGL